MYFFISFSHLFFLFLFSNFFWHYLFLFLILSSFVSIVSHYSPFICFSYLHGDVWSFFFFLSYSIFHYSFLTFRLITVFSWFHLWLFHSLPFKGLIFCSVFIPSLLIHFYTVFPLIFFFIQFLLYFSFFLLFSVFFLRPFFFRLFLLCSWIPLFHLYVYVLCIYIFLHFIVNIVHFLLFFSYPFLSAHNLFSQPFSFFIYLLSLGALLPVASPIFLSHSLLWPYILHLPILTFVLYPSVFFLSFLCFVHYHIYFYLYNFRLY